MDIGALKRLCPPALFRVLQRFSNRSNISIFKRCSQKGINARKLVFLSPTRDSLSGNFWFIYEAIKDRDFEIVVLLEEDHRDMGRVMRHVATAQYILADDYVRYMYTLPLGDKQKFIQVWHSTGALKRMGFSRIGREGSTIQGSLTHRNYTDVIVSAEGVVDNFAEAFGIERSKVHPYGVPRTDIFFDEAYKKQTREDLRARLQVEPDEKLVLFAPTYRGNDVYGAFYPQEFLNVDALARALGSGYVIALKLHPFIKEQLPFSNGEGARVIDVGEYREINDLLLAADILVTDYSSVIFEYALLSKPVVFYAPDMGDYENKRDFFYDYSEYVYGPLVLNQDELAQSIMSIETIKMLDLTAFKEKFLGACDGRSTQRFVENVLVNEVK